MRVWPAFVMVVAVKVAPLLGVFALTIQQDAPPGWEPSPDLLGWASIVAFACAFTIGGAVSLLARQPLRGFDYAATAVGVVALNARPVFRSSDPTTLALHVAIMTAVVLLGAFVADRLRGAE